MSRSPCLHLWATTGRCVKPGCKQMRPAGDTTVHRVPSEIDPNRRAQVVPLLATHSTAAICRELAMSPKTVRKIRDEEARRG